MPWKDTCAMSEKQNFIKQWSRGDLTMTALCRKFGISRQTGYKWVDRWRDFGCCDEALAEFTRTPHSHPSARGRLIRGGDR